MGVCVALIYFTHFIFEVVFGVESHSGPDRFVFNFQVVYFCSLMRLFGLERLVVLRCAAIVYRDVQVVVIFGFWAVRPYAACWVCTCTVALHFIRWFAEFWLLWWMVGTRSWLHLEHCSPTLGTKISPIFKIW